MTRHHLPVDGRRRWVGVGTGRCGTAWVAGLANALGSRTAHEDPVYWWDTLRAGEGWDDYDGCVSLAAARWLHELPSAWPVVHIIRDPVDVVGSWLRARFFADRCDCHPPGAHHRTPYAKFVRRAMPIVYDVGQVDPDDRETARACRYVVQWNLACETVLGPYLRLAVDRFDGLAADDFGVGILGQRPDPDVVAAYIASGGNRNTAPDPPPPPRDALLAQLARLRDGERLLGLCARYGYL